MPLQTPLSLGPFLVDDEGRLTPRTHDAFPAFSVRWRGRCVRAHMTQKEPQDGRLTLQTVLGRIPSTATDNIQGTRPQSFAMLHALKREMPGSWQIRLMPDHSARLEVDSDITLPITAIALVTELTRFLLDLAPYLDLLDEAGVTGVPPSVGMANS